MKLNKKGFVSSAVLYSLLLLFLALVLGLLSLLSNRKQILDKLKGDIKNEINQTKIYEVYENGTAIYYNPVTGKICGDYKEENSLNENKTGCMKWYIFNDNKNRATVNMILDHNTTATVAWNSEGTNTEMKEVKTALESDTSNWKQTARLITADEVAHIVGADKDDTIKWNSSKTYGTNDIETKAAWYFLDGTGTTYSSTNGWQKQVANSTTRSKYAWLYDYTNSCTTYGCNIDDLSTFGYWTSIKIKNSDTDIWYINRRGNFSPVSSSSTDYGVRPVITVSKKDIYIQYKEKILNGADPVYSDNLLPVIIENDGTVKKADLREEWYKYENKKWANAVILKENGKIESDNTIKEESIKEYYVWIPKYSYTLWNVNSNNTETKPIKIAFGSDAKTTGTSNGDTLIHPAFTNFNTNGIWVGKYEISYDEETYTNKDTFLTQNPNYTVTTDSTKLIVKPNVRSLTNKNVSSLFTLIKNSHTNLNSHMMTNMEWGATAYLTYSKYGRCDSDSCTEVTINNINTGYYGSSAVFTGQWNYGPTITGCAGDTVSASVISNSGDCTNKYNTTKGYLASTTGNITGIYDMSGGNWEYVMGVLEDTNGNLYSGRNHKYNSGFKGLYGCPTCDSDTSGLTSNTSGLDFPDRKYYDSYVSSDAIGTDNWYIYTSGKLGDATKEIANTKENSSSGNRGLWFNDYAGFISPTYPFLLRGGSWADGSGAGVLGFHRSTGNSYSGDSARSVLAY